MMELELPKLLHLANECDPIKPATYQQYVDCAGVRGSREFIEALRKEVILSAVGQTYARALFSGHVGTGKSSELARLKTELEAGNPKVLAIIVDAKDYVNEYDADMTDILLGIVAEFGSALPEQISRSMKPKFFRGLYDEVKRLLTSKVELDQVEYSLFDLKTTFQVLPSDEGVRRQVRDQLKTTGNTLIQEINIVFEEGRHRLRDMGYADFVLVVDNLEKVRRFGGAEELAGQRLLFIENSRDFCELKANLVLTVPLALLRRDVGALQAAYGQTSHVLPMVKVVDRQGNPFDTGYQVMRKIAEKRCSGPLRDSIDDEAIDLLIKYTGGDVRQFIGFLRRAALIANGDKITVSDAQTPIKEWVTALGPSVAPLHQARLREIDQSHKVDPLNEIDVHLLEQVYVLEYVNGASNPSSFIAGQDTWYVAHPILKDLYEI
jgi:hypothetical protein